MSLKINQLNQQLRRRIQEQIANEDRAKNNAVPRGIRSEVSKPAAAPALERKHEAQKAGASGVAVRVVIIALRQRLLDSHDNAKSACKGLIDVIAESLGIDDADPRISWQIEQLKTDGEPGTIVQIQTI